MVKQTKSAIDTEALINLTDDALKSIEAVGAEIEKSEKMIEMLEDLGYDMSKQREQLAWGRKARATVLKAAGKE